MRAALFGCGLCFWLLFWFLGGCDYEAEAPPLPPVDRPLGYADPFIGSGGFGYAFGSAFPGAAAPNGMAKVGPDTRGPYAEINFLHYSGYWYGDNAIHGFSHMHLHGTGATDYGVLGVMPLPEFDPAAITRDGYGSSFSKASESARPGSYAVTLDRGPIRVEIAATPHAAHHRYQFPRPGGVILFDLDHHLNGGEVSAAQATLSQKDGTLRGHLHSLGGMSRGYGGYKVYFAARTEHPWRAQKVWSKDQGGQPGDGATVQGTGAGFALFFDTQNGPAVELQIGLSLVSEEGAARNLAAELPDWNFDAARQRTEAAWNDLLSAVLLEGGTEAERRTFYSALYRAFLMPSVHSDGDGQFRSAAPGNPVKKADGFRYVSDLSLWDTYRTLNPLYALVAPERARDVVRSLHEMALALGHFPKWTLAGGDSGTMIGAPAEMVVADAYLRGVRDFDAQGAYARLRAAAMDREDPPGGRGGRQDVGPYLDLGYVPERIGGSVSQTVEYAHGDFALGQLAGALGKAADAQAFAGRAHGYRKLFDPATGFLRARTENGSFPPGAFDPLCFCREFVEANAGQTVWGAPHDAAGLIALFGGAAPFAARLGSFFEQARQDFDDSDPTRALTYATPRPYYWAGNEPDIHAVYLFAHAGRPDLLARWLRWAMDTFYDDTPAGLPGNDDGGTMSAWYVWSALGLYPLAGSDRYTLGVPRFSRARVRVAGGTFVIEAAGRPAPGAAPRSIELDGVALAAPELRHDQLRAGSTLRFIY